MRNILRILTLTVVAVATLAAQEVITVKGSDTMVLLAQRWAEVYMSKHPGVKAGPFEIRSAEDFSALVAKSERRRATTKND